MVIRVGPGGAPGVARHGQHRSSTEAVPAASAPYSGRPFTLTTRVEAGGHLQRGGAAEPAGERDRRLCRSMAARLTRRPGRLVSWLRASPSSGSVSSALRLQLHWTSSILRSPILVTRPVTVTVSEPGPIPAARPCPGRGGPALFSGIAAAAGRHELKGASRSGRSWRGSRRRPPAAGPHPVSSRPEAALAPFAHQPALIGIGAVSPARRARPRPPR